MEPTRYLYLSVIVLLLSGTVRAENFKTIFNPYIGNPDYVTSLSGGACGFNSLTLLDANGNQWTTFSDTSGHLVTVQKTCGSSAALFPHSVVLIDPSSIKWSLTVNTRGDLITTSGASSTGALTTVNLNDPSGVTWVVTVNTGGHLITS